MSLSILPREIGEKLVELYDRMESTYDNIAGTLNFSCHGCPDNCCDSHFLHYTYLEWSHLWEGLRALPPEHLNAIEAKAARHVKEKERSVLRGEMPVAMCPLNEKGLCSLYAHRLMICRLHGVPSVLSPRAGASLRFPGCFRCQEIVTSLPDPREAHEVDRTPFYRELADLETRLLGGLASPMPKIRLTIADMIIKGPPPI